MAVVPSDISSSLNGASDIFTNVQDVIQSAGSLYDVITGKSDGLPPKPAAATAPAPAPVVSPAPAPSLSTQTKYVLIGLGVLVLVLALGTRR